MAHQAVSSISSSGRSRTMTSNARNAFRPAPTTTAPSVKAFQTKARPTVASLTRAGRHRAGGCSPRWQSPPSSTFLTSWAMRRREKVSSASAAAAVLPRIERATRLSLRGSCASLAGRPTPRCRRAGVRRRACLSGPPLPSCRRHGRRKSWSARIRRILADHVLGHQHRDEFVAVVDAEGQPDELREDRRPARPCPDHLVAPGAPRLVRLFQHIAVDKRAFPYRAGQALSRLRMPASASGADGRSADPSPCCDASSCPWSACPMA